MPITLTIDRERRFVYSALHGLITETEFLDHIASLPSSPNFDPAFDNIFDVRGVTEIGAAPEILETVADRPSVFNRESQHVVIASKGAMQEWAKKMKTLSASTRPNFSIVGTPEEAFRIVERDKSSRS